MALTGKRLRTPRAAAIAGILFSCLLIAILLLFLSSWELPRDLPFSIGFDSLRAAILLEFNFLLKDNAFSIKPFSSQCNLEL